MRESIFRKLSTRIKGSFKHSRTEQTESASPSFPQLSEVVSDVEQVSESSPDMERASEIRLVQESDLFDEAWYKEQYKDDIAPDEDVIAHYLSVGWLKGFDPSKQFSTSRYINYYRDVKSAGVVPLVHYINHGKREGRSPFPPEREIHLPFTRITPAETGAPDIVLEYDAERRPVELAGTENICVHVHLYHDDMCREISRYLSHIRYPFTLLVSVKEKCDTDAIKRFFSENVDCAGEIIVKGVMNRGRDVAPWVVEFRDEILKSTLFCHIHTKRSNHSRAHAGWFRYLCHVMLGSPSVVDQILNVFASDQEVGVIGPCYHWSLANQPNYGRNRSVCQKLYARLCSQPLPKVCVDYPAGSFFWARTAALKPLFDLDLTLNDFPEEKGQLDGTIAHGIERIIGFLPSLTDMTYKKATVDIAYNLIRYFGNHREQATEAVYLRNYNSESDKKDGACRIAVYSAITGHYEQPIPLTLSGEGIDRFIVVDDPELALPDGHTKIISNYINPMPVRTARFAKMHPHLFFPDYDYVFWIDSNLHFMGDVYDYIDRINSENADIGFILHPVRDNVVEEMQVLQEEKIVSKELSEKQISKYMRECNILVEPLIECNFFVSRPKSRGVQDFMNTWWAELNQFTHRDQLSVSFAALTTGLKWTNIMDTGLSTRDHPDFIQFSHKYSGRKDIIRQITEMNSW